MRKISIGFADMWMNHVPEKDFFFSVLKEHFPLEISSQPDYLFYSVFGSTHSTKRFDGCVKVFYTGENIRPNMDTCDFALSFDYLDHPRHLRFPLYACYLHNRDLTKQLPLPSELARRKFCNFVYSNRNPQERIAFFRLLSTYKHVDSGGGVLNNLGGRVGDKLSLLSEYKFTIAFENAMYPGYTTEKLVQPMISCSLPIYWGNPLVEREFNRASFLEVDPMVGFGPVVEEIKRLDSDDSAYLEMLSRPWFPDGGCQYCWPDYLVPFFERVFAIRPGSMKREPRAWQGFR
jgi:alpha(1,3/1,4) fucosyltransferase